MTLSLPTQILDDARAGCSLSVVIPAYNEVARIGATVERVLAYLTGRWKHWEVLVVDDGSRDGTAALVKQLRPDETRLRVIAYSPNRGKGYAVRTGVLAAVRQSPLRELAGQSFNLALRVATGLRFRDTQCGFKLFRREMVQQVFQRQRIFTFGFDPEILFLAKKFGFRAIEVPVRWAHSEGSKVRVLRDGLNMVLDLLRIRWNDLTGKYSGSVH